MMYTDVPPRWLKMVKDEPKWVITQEAKERIRKTCLRKFTPEQQENLRKIAEEIEKELTRN